jgi:hypothetical protein
MKDVFIPTQNFQRFQALCDDLLRTPMGLEMSMVIGPAGRGKTRAAERVAVMSPHVVFLRFQERLSPIGLIRELAFGLGGVRPHSTQACFEVIQTELAAQRRIIMVDESDRMSIRHLNTLRDFHDVCKTPVVLIGEEPLVGKIRTERRLMSRVADEMRFEPVGPGDVTVFYKMALGLTLNARAAASLARHSDGDFRMVVNDGLNIERRMRASDLAELTDDLVKEICGNGANGQHQKGA